MIGNTSEFLQRDWWHILDSPKGLFTAHLPSWPQQVKAGSYGPVRLSLLVAALKKEENSYLLSAVLLTSAVLFICTEIHFTDEISGPRDVKIAKTRQRALLSPPRSLQILQAVSIWPPFLREGFCLSKNVQVDQNPQVMTHCHKGQLSPVWHLTFRDIFSDQK